VDGLEKSRYSDGKVKSPDFHWSDGILAFYEAVIFDVFISGYSPRGGKKIA
jgi:hypothetical protein